MEKEMATHSSILAWKSPWTEEPGGLQSMGLPVWACVHKSGGRWVGSNKLVEIKKKKKVASMTQAESHNCFYVCYFKLNIISTFSEPQMLSLSHV